jgi:hypothetical protein
VLTFASEQEQRHAGVSFPDQPLALCARIAAPERLESYAYDGQAVRLETSGGRQLETQHRLMQEA